MPSTPNRGEDHRRIERFLERFNYLVERAIAIDTVARDFGTGHELHRAEIHTIDAIGRHEGINNSELSEVMDVTKGATSQMVSKLVRKGLVQKQPSAVSAREVELRLTKLGRIAFENHEQFEDEMFAALSAHFGDSLAADTERLTSALEELIELVEAYADRVD